MGGKMRSCDGDQKDSATTSSRSGASPQPWPLSALAAKAQCHGSACPAAALSSISGALCAWIWAPALHRLWETRTAPTMGLVIYFFFKFLLFQSHDFVFANSSPQGGEAGRGCCSVSVPLGHTDEALPSRWQEPHPAPSTGPHSSPGGAAFTA